MAVLQRAVAWGACVVFTGSLAGATEPCVARSGGERIVTVTFAPPEGGLVAGLTLIVDYPDEKVSFPGTGTDVPHGTVTDTPNGTFMSANDLGGEVRLVLARPGELPPGKLAQMRFDACEGAPAIVAEDFACRVLDAADPTTNLVRDVTCRVTVP